MIILITLIGLQVLTTYAILAAASRADAWEAKIWAETVENERNDRTLVREEKRVKNENTASREGGGKHDIKERVTEHTKQG